MRTCVWRLEQVRDERVIAPLVEMLENGDGSLRRLAAELLGKVGDVRAVGPLIRALQEGERDLREVAAGALGQLGYIQAVAPLKQALQDADPGVREAAAAALERLGQPHVSRAHPEEVPLPAPGRSRLSGRQILSYTFCAGLRPGAVPGR
jgi:HEAT repeat protein